MVFVPLSFGMMKNGTRKATGAKGLLKQENGLSGFKILFACLWPRTNGVVQPRQREPAFVRAAACRLWQQISVSL